MGYDECYGSGIAFGMKGLLYAYVALMPFTG